MREKLALVSIPDDIDALIATEPETALAWRLRLRDTLMRAFQEGFAIVDFQPAQSGKDPAYVLHRERETRG
jgi:predicted GNAT superfamily acetyltransferase